MIHLAEARVSYLNKGLKWELLVMGWINSSKRVLNVCKTTNVTRGKKTLNVQNQSLISVKKIMSIKQAEEAKVCLRVIIDINIMRQIHKNGHYNENIFSEIKRCAKYLIQQTIRQMIQALILCQLKY